ncbi:hypothetical protein Ctob_011356 [Chrysochromulina tobinii]|uniref:Chromo domain-containing protein n=1 Tax=Chrysochromulina tobinii TaxID=1460289 RepID=A0A0M0JNK6_9EUKA|nr:hypothetical protein Ctob_011356 [Chrysochromulina tobinii]|eukprot:KOO27843.1 hypothetical protein Ctob_011356 [Chrysochromulina sp. CCMP291]
MSCQELEPKEPKDKDRSALVRLDLKSTREALDATDNQRKQPADRLHDWLMLMAEHVEHAQADEKALRVKLDRELSDAAVGAAKAVGTTSVAATLKQRQKLQRQIDGARSRVHEVKDLVRTALAHHFLSALQGRLISQSAYAFSKWADAVGMECPAAMSAASGIIAHISATGDTGVDDGGGTRLRRTSAFASHTAEAVLAQRGQGQVLEYQVKWRGFSDPRGTTWELASQLHGVAGFDEALVSFQASA